VTKVVVVLLVVLAVVAAPFLYGWWRKRRARHGFANFIMASVRIGTPAQMVQEELEAMTHEQNHPEQYLPLYLQRGELERAKRAAKSLNRSLKISELKRVLGVAISRPDFDLAQAVANEMGRPLTRKELVLLVHNYFRRYGSEWKSGCFALAVELKTKHSWIKTICSPRFGKIDRKYVVSKSLSNVFRRHQRFYSSKRWTEGQLLRFLELRRGHDNWTKTVEARDRYYQLLPDPASFSVFSKVEWFLNRPLTQEEKEIGLALAMVFESSIDLLEGIAWEKVGRHLTLDEIENVLAISQERVYIGMYSYVCRMNEKDLVLPEEDRDRILELLETRAISMLRDPDVPGHIKSLIKEMSGLARKLRQTPLVA
jgi:hypothetical protein